MLEKGIALLVIMVSINAMLMLSGALPNNQLSFLSSTGLPNQDINSFSSTTNLTENQTELVDTSVDENQNIFTAIVSGITQIGTPIKIGWDVVWSSLNLVLFLLFGFIGAMQAIGLPAAFVWAIGAPIAAIELFTLFYLVLNAMGLKR